MTAEKSPETKPFPGSPTGNQSGVGALDSTDKKGTEEKPTEAYPGSPTGNASGVGDTPEAKDKD